jgi:hypothetical protein
VHDVSHDIVVRIADLFGATLVYASQKAEEELSKCSLQERIAIERRYGHTNQIDIVMAMVREAADTLGLELRGYTIGKVETEKLQVASKPISFADLIDEIMRISE